MPVELVTRAGVVIARTGSYLLASGPTTFTEEDLSAAVQAWLHDPTVPDRPRLRVTAVEASLGLTDQPEHGGVPAFGYMDNPRIAANGQELLADVHTPQWLDEMLDWAYPSRSVEGAQRVTAASGNRYDFVITGMALLGVELPGISSLDDFPALMAGELGNAEEPVAVLATAASASGVGDHGVSGHPVRAGLDADIVRRRLMDEIQSGGVLPDGAHAYDCWPISLRFDSDGSPYAKVIDEASGRLYRVDITVSGNDVSFAAPVEIVEQDVPVQAGAPVAAQSVMWATRASGPNTNTEDDGMNDDQRRILRTRFGLADDATDDQIMEAAQQTPPPPAASEPDPTSEPTPPQATGAAAGSSAEPQPVAASAPPEGTMLVSAEQWQAQQDRLARIEADAQARQERETTERRDRIAASAVNSGRITPAERQDWRDRLDKNEEVTAEVLASLPASRAVPVTELGGSPQDPTDGGGEREITDDEHEATKAQLGIRTQPRRRGIHHDRQEA